MSPTFRLDARQLPACLRVRRYARRCSKGRLEVREATSFELRFHVPVGALKFSEESHVDSSFVQQTLANTDSFDRQFDGNMRRDLEGDAGHLGRGSSLGSCIPSTHSSLCFGSWTGAAIQSTNVTTPLCDTLDELDRWMMSTVLASGPVLHTDVSICLASAVAEIHSSERCLVHPARPQRVADWYCLDAPSITLTARHALDLKP